MARLIVKHSSAILVLICGALLGIGIVADFLWASSSRFNISYPHWVADKTILIAPDLTPPSKCGVGRRAAGSSGGLGRSLVKSSQPVVTPCGDVMGVVRDKGIFVIFTKKSAHVIPQFGRQKPLLGFVGTGLEEMIRLGVELSRTVARTARPFPICRAPSLISRPSPSRLLHDHINASTASPVALQMIDYALSLARSHKSDESYAQGMLVLEQCLSTQSSENSSGMVLLAMSTLLSERGNIDEAIEKLRIIQDFSSSSLSVRVAASEALVGLHLELGLDDSSSVFADRCLELLEKYQPDDDIGGSEVIYARAKAVKGLVELVHGKLESAESFFQGSEADKGYTGSIALSYGEILHATQKFQPAKVLYQKVIQELAEDKDFSGPHTLAACNMSSKEVSIAATCALGQLEAHLGNFGDAEQILTRALTETEEQFGSHHPKVGVILTCIALMFRRKAIQERSSSLLIQEGLYRKAIELLKAPLETEEVEVNRKDIVALAKGGYAEALCVQQNRKSEGEKMKRWAEAAWKNRRLSLAEALEISEVSSKVPVVDARISRAL